MNALALKQYQAVNINAQVLGASPHGLIQMLIDGGLARIAQARGAMERGQTELKGALITKSIAIVGGLRDALDHEQGGELAANLERLYDYMSARLLQAHRDNEPALLEEVAGLLREIKSAWDAIAQ
ncbi:flagellar export chaperone FliS [Pseudomonas sp. UBA6323]|uniref:flagellar export chaperone FliS n=1 Tax=Pseudomonas sp. UBA6323 TaxID=1947329 RepID=UPI0025CC6938|nr:flagellar export chaperone FliS [Pseudomonas sp. UBA6323]